MTPLHEFLNHLQTLSSGDLLAAMQLADTAMELSNDTTEIPGVSAGLLEIHTLMTEWIKNGFPDNTGELAELVQRLKENISLDDEDTGTKKEEDQVVFQDMEVVYSFIQESNDHLADIEQKILTLEDNDDPDLVDGIFRSMHTIKGVASFIGLSKIKDLSHVMESVLDKMRDRELVISPEIIDDLLGGSDLLQKMIGELDGENDKIQGGKNTISLESDFDTQEKIRKFEGYLSESRQAPVEEKTEVEDDFPEELITPEMVDKFVEESTDLLDGAETVMLEVEKDPNATQYIDDAFRSIHTIKGNAGFFWLGGIERLCMDLESILDSVRKSDRQADQKIVTIILQSIDIIRNSLSEVQKGKIKPGPAQSAEPEEIGGEGGDEADQYEPLGDVLVKMGAVSQEVVDKALDMQQMRLGEILVEEGATTKETVESALTKQTKTKNKDTAVSSSQYAIKRKDIRVDTERLDKLFNLMGELITAEAMVINNPDLQGMESPNFERAGTYLAKITREMQEITMAIRMIPLDGLFNKMRRLVRDLARKFDKKINLDITGEDTEMDRNVIEEISDPLVHIIRNAIDHGIESTKKRQEVGKSETGNISLDAKYEGNEIWITISDDGAGLNRDKIFELAIKRGIIEEDAELSDQEVWQLIFEPGFSTSDKVSEISGRGVGMDVVRKNLEKLRGRIDIRSYPGEGTDFILRIPLTLAIIDGITFRVGSMLYSLPLTDILQFHKADIKQITETERGQRVLKLRNDLMPIIELHRFFNASGEAPGLEEGIFIICTVSGKYAALLVDEIIGNRQLVIKAMPAYMGEVRAISGCSIMGDGDVCLIIDAGALLQYCVD